MKNRNARSILWRICDEHVTRARELPDARHDLRESPREDRGASNRGSPILIVAPSVSRESITNRFVPNTMMVEPCSNQPSSSPFANVRRRRKCPGRGTRA